MLSVQRKASRVQPALALRRWHAWSGLLEAAWKKEDHAVAPLADLSRRTSGSALAAPPAQPGVRMRALFSLQPCARSRSRFWSACLLRGNVERLLRRRWPIHLASSFRRWASTRTNGGRNRRAVTLGAGGCFLLWAACTSDANKLPFGYVVPSGVSSWVAYPAILPSAGRMCKNLAADAAIEWTT